MKDTEPAYKQYPVKNWVNDTILIRCKYNQKSELNNMD